MLNVERGTRERGDVERGDVQTSPTLEVSHRGSGSAGELRWREERCAQDAPVADLKGLGGRPGKRGTRERANVGTWERANVERGNVQTSPTLEVSHRGSGSAGELRWREERCAQDAPVADLKGLGGRPGKRGTRERANVGTWERANVERGNVQTSPTLEVSHRGSGSAGELRWREERCAQDAPVADLKGLGGATGQTWNAGTCERGDVQTREQAREGGDARAPSATAFVYSFSIR